MMRITMILAFVLEACAFAQSPQSSETESLYRQTLDLLKNTQANTLDENGQEGPSAGVSLLSQAALLARYARESESPVAMLAAAKMINAVRLQDGADRIGEKQPSQQQGGESVTEARKANPPAPTVDATTLLEEAKPWAAKDTHLTALLNDALKKTKPVSTGTLGSLGGVVVHRDSVKARSHDDFLITFNGLEQARIAVVGDGVTDLALIVFDEYGHEIVRYDNRSSACAVRFTPRWTAQFRVRVLNRSDVYSNYLLITN
jgi:hypothetical protein